MFLILGNSMSDLFHPNVPESFIKAVFSIMNPTPQTAKEI